VPLPVPFCFSFPIFSSKQNLWQPGSLQICQMATSFETRRQLDHPYDWLSSSLYICFLRNFMQTAWQHAIMKFSISRGRCGTWWKIYSNVSCRKFQLSSLKLRVVLFRNTVYKLPSHVSPVKPASHWQTNPFVVWTHRPRPRHGIFRQSASSAKGPCTFTQQEWHSHVARHATGHRELPL